MPSFKPTHVYDKKKLVIDMEKDDNGVNILTEAYIRELCEQNGQYTTPSLNDTLYLHFKGFKKI